MDWDVVGVGDWDVVGEELMGEDMMGALQLQQALKPRLQLNRNALQAARLLRLPPKLPWRQEVVTNGVNAPRDGLWPMPMRPQANDGVLDDANQQIEFLGTPQKPFRGERLVAVVSKSAGASGINVRVDGGVVVGTTPQLVDFGSLPLEAYQANAFGVRLKLDPAAPGIFIRMQVRASSPVPVGETIAVDIQILGSTVI